LYKLKKHSERIEGYLKENPEDANRFLSDPLAIINKLCIPINNHLKEKIKQRITSNNINPEIVEITLPNGRTIKFKVRTSVGSSKVN
jgi:hypothetical protein